MTVSQEPSTPPPPAVTFVDDVLVSASEVARQLGLATETLRKWRRLGKGPQGAIKTSPTTVSYWKSEVTIYKESLLGRERKRDC